MLRLLHRILPTDDARRLVGLICLLGAAATLHGVTLGLAGILLAVCLGAVGDPLAWMIALVVSIICFVLAQWIAQMIAFRVGSSTARALHLRLGEHLADLPLGWFTASLQARVIDLATSGVPQAMSYPAILLRPALTALVTPVAAALTLALLDWRFTVAILAMTAVAWAVSRLSSQLARTVDARRHTVSAEATRRILEYTDRQPLIRTDQGPDDTDALDHALHDVERTARRSAGAVIPGLVLFSVTLNVVFATLVGLGMLWVTDATLTIPVLLGVLVVAARLTAVAAAGAELAAGLRLQTGILERLATVLDAPALPIRPAAGATEYDDELVRVEHVTFGYDTGTVLHDVSFTVPRRGLIAIVGPSGSGKTTLIRLLARFWDSTTGRIFIDGADLRSLGQDDIAEKLAIVLQDDYLLEGTIGDNIRLGNPKATDDAITAAIHSTGLGPLIGDLPEGIDSPVGPGGARLSGGQRQRICVARALLKAAPLTILDEATSALDPESSRLVAEAVEQLATTRAVLVIAHNLDTVKRADRILVFEHGRLVQQGSHAQLAEQPGIYRELLDNAASPHTDSGRDSESRLNTLD